MNNIVNMVNLEAIVSEYVMDNSEKIQQVRSCSDCCMESNPDGTPNIVGRAFQATQTRTVTNVHGTYSWVDCAHCPITQNMTNEEWSAMLADIDGCE